MHRVITVAASLAARAASTAAFAQEPQLTPVPAPAPTAIGHQFQPDLSGGFSRTIFATDESPDFKVIIRDFAFPPDKQPHNVTLSSGAFVDLIGGEGEISIAKKRLQMTPGARSAVPAGAPIEVVNKGERLMVIRALILEAK
ncbi:MAG: hypothetical protein J2P49_01810 [Methylocapsa sp.]|nr:hypothetical protein [Methylocapsa sp.]